MSDRIDENINLDGLDMFEGQDETFEMITMTEEDGTQQSFYVIDGIDVDDTRYLLLVKEEDYELDEPEAYIFKETSTDGEDFIYEPVEDEQEYNRIFLLLQDEDSEYEVKITEELFNLMISTLRYFIRQILKLPMS